MKIRTYFVFVLLMVLMDYACCAYSREESVANAYYAAITHCPGKEI